MRFCLELFIAKELGRGGREHRHNRIWLRLAGADGAAVSRAVENQSANLHKLLILKGQILAVR